METEEIIIKLNKDLVRRIRHIKNGAGPKTYVRLHELVESIDEIVDLIDGRYKGYKKLLEHRETLDTVEKA